MVHVLPLMNPYTVQILIRAEPRQTLRNGKELDESLVANLARDYVYLLFFSLCTGFFFFFLVFVYKYVYCRCRAEVLRLGLW